LSNKNPLQPNDGRKQVRLLQSILICLVGLLIIAAGYTIIVAKPILLPLVLALLITLILNPVQRLLVKAKIPTPIAAALVVIVLLVGTVFGMNSLSMPAAEWGKTLDLEYAEKQIKDLFAPVQEIQEGISNMARKVDAIADGEDNQKPNGEGDATDEQEKSSSDAVKVKVETNPDGSEGGVKEGNLPVKVEIKEKTETEFLNFVQELGLHTMATLLLIYFFLAYGSKLHDRLSESEASTRLMKSLGSEVSRYLFTITAINVSLGICITLTMWLLGMPNPVLWGVMGALFNFIPYIGAIVGSVVVFLVAVVTFTEPGQAIVIPLVYFGLTALEGNVITPMIIGRRFALNPIMVVLWFMSWGAVWGVAGMLIATPTLMGVKIVCANIPSLKRVDRIISL